MITKLPSRPEPSSVIASQIEDILISDAPDLEPGWISVAALAEEWAIVIKALRAYRG